MNWVLDDLTAPSLVASPVSGTAVSKVFHAEDPRYLAIDITGSVTNFKLQGRAAGGSWRDIKVQSAGTRLVFNVENDGDLLDEQLRVVTLATQALTKVFVTRAY